MTDFFSVLLHLGFSYHIYSNKLIETIDLLHQFMLNNDSILRILVQIILMFNLF